MKLAEKILAELSEAETIVPRDKLKAIDTASTKLESLFVEAVRLVEKENKSKAKKLLNKFSNAMDDVNDSIQKIISFTKD